ncbi:MAG TPA: hypothetical protein VIL32_04705 [Steroidobacteraceae bacterium]
MLGRFHEIGISTRDIRASVEFYERLGFVQATTGDTWSHPYGVLTDGRVALGLHQQSFDSPRITFVREGIAEHAEKLEALGIELAWRHTGEDVFHEVGFRDPAGQMVTVIEARTYFPLSQQRHEESLCGYFTELSIPSTDFEAGRIFWERLGFVATEEVDAPYVHMTLVSDHLDLAFHRPRTLDRPMLVFSDPAMRERIARLREMEIPFSNELPRGLNATGNALIEAPEGTLLLLLEQDA